MSATATEKFDHLIWIMGRTDTAYSTKLIRPDSSEDQIHTEVQTILKEGFSDSPYPGRCAIYPAHTILKITVTRD